MVRAPDKADAMLTLSSALQYNTGSHLPFIYHLYPLVIRWSDIVIIIIIINEFV